MMTDVLSVIDKTLGLGTFSETVKSCHRLCLIFKNSSLGRSLQENFSLRNSLGIIRILQTAGDFPHNLALVNN